MGCIERWLVTPEPFHVFLEILSGFGHQVFILEQLRLQFELEHTLVLLDVVLLDELLEVDETFIHLV